MQKGIFKHETHILYTSWDLNCRSIVPHNPVRNAFEKKIKRMARRKNKEKLKEILDNQPEA